MFQVKDLTKVLESLPEDDNTILIGGQALNVWAEYYSELDAALTTHSPFFSNDIDFLGDKQAATALHDAWKGTIKIPDMDTHTAMTAKLTFKLEDGRPVNVDFLEVMIGVDNYHIRKEALKINTPPSQKSILVLHPAHCLASRIYNTYGILDRRTRYPGDHHVKRTRLAVKILNHNLTDLFKKNDERASRQAYRFIEYTASLSCEDPAKRAFHLDNIDVLDAIPRNPELGISEKFLTERLPRIQTHVALKRKIYISNVQRIEQKRSSMQNQQDHGYDREY